MINGEANGQTHWPGVYEQEEYIPIACSTGNISDYVLLVVPYTSRGSGGVPPRKYLVL